MYAQLARLGPRASGERAAGERPVTPAQRRLALFLTAFFVAITCLVFPSSPAAGDGLPGSASSGAALSGPAAGLRADLCTVEEWRSNLKGCVDRLSEVAGNRVQCLKAPTPDAPDSGLAGWFASRPESSREPGVQGVYSNYGYAGYSYTTYDIGCTATVMHPDYKFENTVANGEFMLASAVVGASNAVRERAWDPGVMWGWADPLVEQATRSVYTRVFTVFGVVTLGIVGLYLLWRSRQAEMSAAMTTAGWALLVMVVVTALAAWPVFSAHLADKALISGLDVVHSAVGPPAKDVPLSECAFATSNPDACKDHRPPAVRASDTAVETMLLRNWLRGMLGSADSATAQKYGEALYQARSFSWVELEDIRANPELRDQKIQQKNNQWMKIAEQIRVEDPEAYEYLQGTRGMDRIGSGFIALLAAVLFAMFDLTASLLVLLGFLIFRWAVIAAPILGTVALLRPASAGFRRLVNAVVAALFNIIIFGTGAAIYLFAVDLVMSTPTLPGWLQVVLIWLCGVVGWLLLRPYRRITQLGGRDSAATVASAGSWHRRFFSDARQAAALSVTLPEERKADARRSEVRVEALERPEFRADPAPVVASPSAAPASSAPPRRMPAPSGGGWSEPESVEPSTAYTVYRPGRGVVTMTDEPVRSDLSRPSRAEARRD